MGEEEGGLVDGGVGESGCVSADDCEEVAPFDIVAPTPASLLVI